MMTTTNTQITRRPLWACLALVITLLLAAPAAFAGDYNGYSGGYSGGWHHDYQPAPVRTTSSNSGRRYYYSTNGYQSGSGGFGWLNYNSGQDNNNGYSGSGASNNTPHRADWEAKLRAQREWDEKQYAQQNDGRTARCGFTGAPAYCYRLQGPYPTEMKVVRY